MKIKKLFTGITLIEKKFQKNKIYYFLKTPNVSIVISKIKNKFLVVSQRRIPINKITFEFPGGAIDPGSNSKKAAMIELFEETGYKCNGKIKKLFTIFPEPGRLKCKYYCYFANTIKKINKPEKGIKLHFLSKKQILNLINKEKFSHACHAYAFLKHLSKIR